MGKSNELTRIDLATEFVNNKLGHKRKKFTILRDDFIEWLVEYSDFMILGKTEFNGEFNEPPKSNEGIQKTSFNKLSFDKWIVEIRRIAKKAKVFNHGDKKPMNDAQIKDAFSELQFDARFKDGLTPQEAFEVEMEWWNAD